MLRTKLWAIQQKNGSFCHDPYPESGLTVLLFKTKKRAEVWLEEPDTLRHFWRQRGVKVVPVVVKIEDAL
jgi:hypothetical protein